MCLLINQKYQNSTLDMNFNKLVPVVFFKLEVQTTAYKVDPI